RAQLCAFLDALRENANLDRDILARFRSVSWDMVLRWQRAGMTVGSHTRTHALLTNETDEDVWEEVRRSRCDLERRLGTRVRHFAYPDGRFNAAALDAVHRAGYRYAYTTCSHRDARRPLLTIPRRILWEHSAI